MLLRFSAPIFYLFARMFVALVHRVPLYKLKVCFLGKRYNNLSLLRAFILYPYRICTSGIPLYILPLLLIASYCGPETKNSITFKAHLTSTSRQHRLPKIFIYNGQTTLSLASRQRIPLCSLVSGGFRDCGALVLYSFKFFSWVWGPFWVP